MNITRAGSQPSTRKPGDVVWIQEALDGRAVEWMEQVTDAQYAAGVLHDGRET